MLFKKNGMNMDNLCFASPKKRKKLRLPHNISQNGFCKEGSLYITTTLSFQGRLKEQVNWSKFRVSTLLPLSSEQVISSQKSIRLVKHYLHLVNSCWLLPAGVVWELWHKSRTGEAIDFACSTPLSPRDTTS